ncbi:MAG TPA: molybdopterin-dependent oxidoreductase [Mycobacteriales bacterium]|nr:molybdopterin-dependent oxidoreductase [Mycobacteriales bacterium]
MTVRLLAGLALAALLAGCGGGDPAAAPDRTADGAAVVLRAATLHPGEPVPAPVGTPLITVTGKVGAATQGGTLALDRRTLARLTQVRLTTYEPWVKRDLSFRGVWLTDLLALAGATGVTEVRVSALDDYEVGFDAAELRAGGILLATSDGDGADIPIDDGGPTRIVFQRGLKAGVNADQWIWSLRSIEVR